MTAGWSGGIFTRGNGTYEGADVWADDKAASVKIVASRHDTHDQVLADGINACLTKDGANTPSTNMSWIHSQKWLGTLGGSSSTYTSSPSPSVPSYRTGDFFRALANHDCTGASTINISSLGAKNIKKKFGGAVYDLSPGDIRNGQLVDLTYDGTQFLILGVGNIDKTTTIVDVTNTATEANLYSKSILANTLGSYGRLIFEGNFDLDVGAGTPNLDIRFKYGSTTLVTLSWASLSATTTTDRYAFRIRAELIANASTSSQRGMIGHISYATPSNAGTGLNIGLTPNVFMSSGGSSTATEDSTTSLDYKISADWNATSSDHSCRLVNGILRYE